MKFLVDAQLPRRLVFRLQESGHEAIHTLDLPLGNRTPDSLINDFHFWKHTSSSPKMLISSTLFSCAEDPSNCY